MDRLDTPFGPTTEPHDSGRLAVGDGHEIYWEACGNPKGLPVLFVHGGPGGRIKPYYRRMFDPHRFRAILFEQRGCGRSTPFAALEHNTTQHLVADMERLREHLGVARWVVTGGSWGSCLALAYVQAHPQMCLGMVISGVTLGRPADLWWWWQGVRFVFPEVWDAFAQALPEPERADLRANYLARILHPDPAIHGPACVALLRYELQTLDVWADPDLLDGLAATPDAIAASRLLAHYDQNNFFLAENQLIAQAERLRDVPGTIVAGRFDMCTPPQAAYDLNQAWPGSRLVIAPVAGHRWSDPLLAQSITSALAAHADRLHM